MKYHVSIYFKGPRSTWAGKVDPSEIVHQFEAPWLWLARVLARSGLGNAGRCGYEITRGNDTVEQWST